MLREPEKGADVGSRASAIAGLGAKRDQALCGLAIWFDR